MDAKDIFSLIKDILLLIVAIAGFLYGVYNHNRNRKLEKEKFEYQREKVEREERKQEIKEATEVLEKAKKNRSESELYCDHVTGKFKYLDFTGLNAILQKPLLLEHIYVRLKAKKSFNLMDYHSIADFHELEKEMSGETGGDDFTTVFENLHNEFQGKKEPMKMVILGHPGSGKTTLMKWIALQCASDVKSVFSSFTPVFIPLKDFGRDPGQTFKKHNILDLTIARLKNENVSASFIPDRFENNRIVFLLDGLDEIGDESLRRETIQWIESQHIRKNTLLATSRFSGLQEAKGLKFQDAVPVFSVMDFNMDDVSRFLENWYNNIEAAVAGDVGGKEREQSVLAGRNKYNDLMGIIKDDQYENLRLLAVNPLLLTIIAIVYRTRAVLPKERHKLYEECLKVMIESWNIANRKLDVSFSVDNSLHHLARVAVHLMKENSEEIYRSDMETLLPKTIVDQPLKSFLDEMVVKAGILYESEGKYGFQHLTFQEYLAAWHFAHSENPLDILEYREHGHWTETFKLFVNIGNAKHFFKEIIDHLEEKNKAYWTRMDLWDSCLKDIVIGETQERIERQFAEKVLDVLVRIPYNEESEPMIIQLYAHYPLYKYAGELVEKGWKLYRKARHPFVQSVGSSILFRAGGSARSELIEQVKQQMEECEKKEETLERLIDFIFQHNNSFVLLIAGTKRLSDYVYALSKVKSRNKFVMFVALCDLSDRSDPRDLRPLRSFGDISDLSNFSNLSYLNYLRDLGDLRDLSDLRDLRYFGDLRALCGRFLERYAPITREHKKELEDWAEKIIAKHHSKSNKQLLIEFPETTREELEEFRKD